MTVFLTILMFFFSNTGSVVYVFVSYNGVWELQGNKWIFKDPQCTVIPMEDTVTYLQLLDILHKELIVDKQMYGLKLEVPYTCGDQPFTLVHVEGDLGVRAFLGVTSKERLALCVTPVKKILITNPYSTPRLEGAASTLGGPIGNLRDN